MSNAASFLLLVGTAAGILFLLFSYAAREHRRGDGARENEDKNRDTRPRSPDTELASKKFDSVLLDIIEKQIDSDFSSKKIFELLISLMDGSIDHHVTSYLYLSPDGLLVFESVAQREVSLGFIENTKKEMLASLGAILDRDMTGLKLEENIVGNILPEDENSDVGSYFNIPLVLFGEPVGVFCVSSPKRGVYTEELVAPFYIATRRFLETLSKIEGRLRKETDLNKKMTNEFKQRMYQTEVLKELGERIGYSLDLAKIIEIITRSVGQLLEYHVIAYVVETKGKIIFKADVKEPVNHAFIDEVEHKILESFSAVLGKPIKPEEVDESVSGAVLSDELSDGVNSFFNLPLIINQKVVGLIMVASPRAGVYTEENTNVLYTITSQASTAVTRLNEVLEREKGRLNYLVSSLNDGVVMFNSHWELEIINIQAKKLLGLPEAEVGLFDVLDKLSSKIDIRSQIERAVSKNIDIPKSLITLGDKILEIVILRVKDNDGENLGAVVVFHDVTESQKAKEIIEREVVERTHELQEEHARMLASINSLSLGFALINLKQEIVVHNQAMMRILEAKDGEPLFDTISEKLNGSFDLKGSYELCVKEKKAVDVKDLQFGTKFIRAFLTPVVIAQGETSEVIGVVMLIEDITEAKIMERSRDEFFAVASHELRTPLTAIRGNIEMILGTPNASIDKDTQEMLTDVEEASVRLISIVNDFLEVSRLEQGTVALEKERFDVQEVIEKVIKMNELSATSKHLTLAFEKPSEPLPQALGDKDKVEQILTNLVGNSIKFTKEGSVSVSAEKTDGFVRIRVRDTGPGIPLENQSLLFRKFQPAGSDTLARDATKSTGLGLYISKLLIAAMGGDIELEESEPGKGSVFSFTVPL